MRYRSPDTEDLIKVRPRTSNTQISRGRTAFICDHGGEAHPEHAIEGLYVYDTRVLSHYAWKMNGKQPQFSCGSPIEQFSWMGYFIQLRKIAKKPIPQNAIRCRRRWSCALCALWARACTRTCT